MLNPFDDNYFMKQALIEAQKALDADEVPVGAVVVCNNQIVGRGHNLTERLTDVTAHAEMQAITAAANTLGSKYLSDCILYVTLEPCLMCAGAIFWARPAKVVYGASDPKRGYSILNKAVLHPKTEVIPGILEAECANLITGYFKAKRK